jgi:hypothetical protein
LTDDNGNFDDELPAHRPSTAPALQRHQLSGLRAAGGIVVDWFLIQAIASTAAPLSLDARHRPAGGDVGRMPIDTTCRRRDVRRDRSCFSSVIFAAGAAMPLLALGRLVKVSRRSPRDRRDIRLDCMELRHDLRDLVFDRQLLTASSSPRDEGALSTLVSAPVVLQRRIGRFFCDYAADGHRFADCSVMAMLVITGGSWS